MCSGRDLFGERIVNQSLVRMGWHFCFDMTHRGLGDVDGPEPDGRKCYTFKWKCFVNCCGKYELYVRVDVLPLPNVCDTVLW